jgi:hypothetical protein
MLSFDSLALLVEMDKLIQITKTKKLADAGLFLCCRLKYRVVK